IPRVPSPIDAFFEARSASDFRKLVSTQLREAFLPFLRELQVPLLFPAVVGRTIEDSIAAADDRMFQRVERWKLPILGRDGALRRALRGLARRMIGWAFGADDEIAFRATRALTIQGGLDASTVAKHLLGYDDTAANHRVML